MVSNRTAEELQEARRALESMLRKSEKTLTKLTADSWQFRLTAGHIHGLRTALALLAGDRPDGDMEQARESLADALNRVEKIEPSLAEGSPQKTLATRRIDALQMGLELIDCPHQRRTSRVTKAIKP